MRTLRAAALATCMAAFSWAAVAQQCMPSEAMRGELERDGWRYHDALETPGGAALAFYCRDEGIVARLVVHHPDGRSCQFVYAADGCFTPIEHGTES
ncbi:MAG: hypothetical protein AAFX39_12620 [Pseudomonadota bacterium]